MSSAHDLYNFPTWVGTAGAVLICAAIAVSLIYSWVNKDLLLTRNSLFFGYIGLVGVSVAIYAGSFLNDGWTPARVALGAVLGALILGHHLMWLLSRPATQQR